MRRIALFALLASAFTGCVKGEHSPACAAGETNRCTCANGLEGTQQCLDSRQAFGACACVDPCAGRQDCVAVPALIGMDLDQAGAAVAAAGLRLPDPVDAQGFITVQHVADPPAAPVVVLDQKPPAATMVKPGTRLVLTVTLPPDEESLALPNSNESNFLVGKLTQDTEESAQIYYDVLDPGPFPTRATLADWKDANGFGTEADAEASAIYMTHTDLGFGRHMHMRRKGKRVAFYVDNFPTIEDTIAGTGFFATVAMEYSAGPRGDDSKDPYFTQFYVFNKKGERITDPILDDHGPKLNPAVCLVCHGGNVTDLSYAKGANLGARFIPFDLDAESFVDRPGYRREDQQAAFKAFNEAVAATWQDAAADYPANDPPPVPELIDLWYGGPGRPSTAFLSGQTPQGWSGSPQAVDLYQKVFARSCQTCHSQREATRNFSSYDKFVKAKPIVEERVFDHAAMPLSQRGFLNFWLSYPHQPKILADWLGKPLRSPGSKPQALADPLPGAVVTAGTKVTLDGTRSKFAETFDWRQTGGPAVELVPATVSSSQVSFRTPPRGTSLAFELKVSALGRTSDPFPVNVTSRSVPDAPGSAQAFPGVLGTATVQWTPSAFDGLSPIKSYKITIAPGGAIVSAGPSETSVLIGALQPAVAYTFAVSAVNDVGESAPATASLVAPTLPGPPVIQSAVSTHEGGTLRVTWTPPADTGGIELDGYTVTCSPSGNATAGKLATSALVTGLANLTTYSCTVVARSAAGSSAPSLAAAGTPDGPPGPPQDFLASSGGGATWNLEWAPPVDKGSQAGITDYVVSWTPATSGSPATFLASAICPGPCAVSLGAADGLVAGETYTFSVAAKNEFGPGPLTSTTPPGKPVITSPLPGSSTGPNEIAVVWDAAAENGSTITQYVARATQTTAPFTVVSAPPVPGTQLSTTISGLSNCTSYDVTVTATSGAGNTTSDPVTSVTPRQAPDVPATASLSLAKVNGSVGELLFSWGASDPHGCGTVTYTVEVTPPGETATPSNVGTVTSYDMVTTTAACPYPAVDCNTPRVWSFQVRASSAGGDSALSASISGTPRLGYSRDQIYTVWNTVLPPPPGTLRCLTCHSANNTLILADGADTTHATSWNNIRATPNVVVLSPLPAPDSSLLHLCPTNPPNTLVGCSGTKFVGGTPFSVHPGGLRYPVGSPEDALIRRWIADGALF